MGKFDGILLCTDLDGTLYKNDKTVSRENAAAIEEFKREGGSFTFITGRLPYYSKDAYNAVKPNVPFGCINGGGLYDGEKEKYVWGREMPKSVFNLVFCIERAFPEVGIQLCSFEKTYFYKENAVTERFRAVTGLPDITMEEYRGDEAIAKIIFCTDIEREIQSIEKALREHPLAKDFDFVRSERTLFEILPKETNKGVSLERLTEHLGIDPKRTVAVGDYFNDIGMFKAAGLGIAVANACPQAKAAADYVTVSNEEHAIAKIISEIGTKIFI